MTAQSMDVFALREKVIDDYKRFATSFTTIFAEDIRDAVNAIYQKQHYLPEPLLQINPNYKPDKTIEEYAESGMLDPGCASLFRVGDGAGESLRLYRHQEEALSLAANGDSYVVTTGTGSSKSLAPKANKATISPSTRLHHSASAEPIRALGRIQTPARFARGSSTVTRIDFPSPADTRCLARYSPAAPRTASPMPPLALAMPNSAPIRHETESYEIAAEADGADSR